MTNLPRTKGMTAPAIQDAYLPEFSHCYGCGTRNPQGHRLRSCLNGNQTIARFTPDTKYSGGVPDHVYGGLIASLLDCHGTASAAAFSARLDAPAAGNATPLPRFVTASLKVDFKRPTPMGVELILRGVLRSLAGRKAWIDMTLSAGEDTCAVAEMLAIRLADGH